MLSWVDVEVRQMEHEQRLQRLAQATLLQGDAILEAPADRWQWRVMIKVGGWLVASGSRLQAHVETARQVVRASSLAAEANSHSTQPCP